MKVCVCAIAKMENHYIREWVEHYKNIGFDKIFLYDNNDVDGERFEEVIDDYIQSSFVEITDVRGKKKYQNLAYENFYQQYGDEFDWILYIDIDEFLVIGNYKNIKELLSDSKYIGFDEIGFEWCIMDDNDLIEVIDNNYSCINRFTRGKMYRDGKRIVRGHLSIDIGFTPHGIYGLNCCDVTGKHCISKIDDVDTFLYIQPYLVNSDICIKHFMFKTIQEYIDNKMVRLYPDRSDEVAKSKLTIDRFFRYNKKTQDKIDYIKSRGFKI